MGRERLVGGAFGSQPLASLLHPYPVKPTEQQRLSIHSDQKNPNNNKKQKQTNKQTKKKKPQPKTKQNNKTKLNPK